MSADDIQQSSVSGLSIAILGTVCLQRRQGGSRAQYCKVEPRELTASQRQPQPCAPCKELLELTIAVLGKGRISGPPPIDIDIKQWASLATCPWWAGSHAVPLAMHRSVVSRSLLCCFLDACDTSLLLFFSIWLRHRDICVPKKLMCSVFVVRPTGYVAPIA